MSNKIRIFLNFISKMSFLCKYLPKVLKFQSILLILNLSYIYKHQYYRKKEMFCEFFRRIIYLFYKTSINLRNDF